MHKTYQINVLIRPIKNQEYMVWFVFTPIVEIADVHVIIQQAPNTFLSKLSCYVTELLYNIAKCITKACYNKQYYDPEPYFYLHC